jgi:hypothetical protein
MSEDVRGIGLGAAAKVIGASRSTYLAESWKGMPGTARGTLRIVAEGEGYCSPRLRSAWMQGISTLYRWVSP